MPHKRHCLSHCNRSHPGLCKPLREPRPSARSALLAIMARNAIVGTSVNSGRRLVDQCHHAFTAPLRLRPRLSRRLLTHTSRQPPTEPLRGQTLHSSEGGLRSSIKTTHTMKSPPPRPRGLLPSRAGACRNHRRNSATLHRTGDGQRRIMAPLCVRYTRWPFLHTLAWPPALRIRLARSAHAPGLRPPFGLEQKRFCPLGSSPVVVAHQGNSAL